MRTGSGATPRRLMRGLAFCCPRIRGVGCLSPAAQISPFCVSPASRTAIPLQNRFGSESNYETNPICAPRFANYETKPRSTLFSVDIFSGPRQRAGRRASCRGHRPEAQLPDDHARSRVWGETGVLSGTRARTQGYGTEQRRRVLSDALLFASARKYGCAVLSRNVRDFDLLQQLDPSGRVMFYKIGAP